MEKIMQNTARGESVDGFLKRAVAEAIERNNSQATANKEG